MAAPTYLEISRGAPLGLPAHLLRKQAIDSWLEALCELRRDTDTLTILRLAMGTVCEFGVTLTSDRAPDGLNMTALAMLVEVPALAPVREEGRPSGRNRGF